MTKKTWVLIALVALALAVVGCGDKQKQEAQVEEKKIVEPEVVTTGSGLKYIDLKVGEGPVADQGMNVSTHYTLWLDVKGEKGRKIDSSLDPGKKPLEFAIGGPLIDGWNEGMLGMQAGGLRRLYVPFHLGYKEAGRPPIIPGSANLIFEIELLEIK